MQITRVEDAVKAAEGIAGSIENISDVEVFIAPSFNSLYSVGKAISNSKLMLAGQNCYTHDKGAFTGETSIYSLVDSGCSYIILGHSERRRIFKETDKIINQKVHNALDKGLKPVLCIGETAKEREEGRMTEVNQEQLTGSLAGISTRQLREIVIAYEPVWAINNKFLNPGIEIKPATPSQAKESHQIAREWIKRNYGVEAAEAIRIIYGGSMKASNADELLAIEDIDGGLVGGASLSADTFVPIIRAAEKITSSNYKWEGNTLKFSE